MKLQDVQNQVYHHYRNEDVIEDLQPFTCLANRIVFVFFDPWTIRVGKVPSIIKYICAKGFKVLASNYTLMKEGDIEQIYRKNPPITMKTSWHLPREVYSMGESCGLLFYLEDNSMEASSLMKTIKGKSNPVLNEAGCIRYDFRAPNKSLSLMHSSDDWFSMLNECTIFFSKDFLKKKFNTLLRGEILFEPPCLSQLQPYASMVCIKEEAASSLLIKIRLRILQILINEDIVDVGATELMQLWKEYMVYDFLRHDVKEEMTIYDALIEREAPFISVIIDAFHHNQLNLKSPRLYQYSIQPGNLILTLQMLNQPQNYSLIDGDEILRLAPVFYNQWEKLLFKTTLFHFQELKN
jgi:nucleoside diphosphate kinase